MKLLVAFLLGLHGASAFPFVLETLEKRAAGQSGCSTSAKCNEKYDVSDAEVGYDPNNPTAAQKANAAVPNCGALTPCFTFDATAQKGGPDQTLTSVDAADTGAL